jgi:glycogen operon protein
VEELVTHWFTREDGRTFLTDGDRKLQWRIDGSAVGDTDFLLCLNMSATGAFFFLPGPHAGRRWVRIVDTARWAEAAGNAWTPARAETVEGSYWVHPWSVLILQEIA